MSDAATVTLLLLLMPKKMTLVTVYITEIELVLLDIKNNTVTFNKVVIKYKIIYIYIYI